MEEDGAKLAVRDADGNRAVVYGGAAAPARAEAAGGGAGGLPPLAGKKWRDPVFSAGGRGAGRTVVPAGQRGERAAPSGAGVPAGKAGAATPHPVRKSAAGFAGGAGPCCKAGRICRPLAHAAQLPRETPQDAAWFIMPLAQWRDVPPELEEQNLAGGASGFVRRSRGGFGARRVREPGRGLCGLCGGKYRSVYHAWRACRWREASG